MEPPANSAPVFTSSPVLVADASVDSPYEGSSLLGAAADSDPVSYFKVSGPEWLNVAVNGDLSGSPSPDDAGLNIFIVRAADSATATTDAELHIMVEGLPLPWKSRDIGKERAYSTALYDGGVYTQHGTGVIGGTKDTFRFTYQILSKNGSITAKVDSLPEMGSVPRFGIMIRSSLAQNARHVFMGLANEKSYRWVTRSNEGGKAATKSSTMRSKNETWVRLVAKNGRITAYKSANGTNWTYVGTTRFEMPDECYIGLAVAGGKNRNRKVATFTNVTVNP